MFGPLISLLSRRSLSPGAVQDVSAIAATSQREALEQGVPEVEESALLTTLGWISAGLGAVAVGLFVGRELRSRYKFNRRTPYEFYSHSGDEFEDMEFGVGI